MNNSGCPPQQVDHPPTAPHRPHHNLITAAADAAEEKSTEIRWITYETPNRQTKSISQHSTKAENFTHAHTLSLPLSLISLFSYAMKRSGASAGHRRAASDGASKAVAEAAAAEAAVPFLLQPEDEEDVVAAESLARVRKLQERSAGAEQDVQGLTRTEELEGREAQEGEDAEEEEGEVLSQTNSECGSTDYAAGDGSTAASPYVS